MVPHRIANLSYAILKRENIVKNSSCRISNFKTLYDGLKGSNNCQPVYKNINELTTAPLYFPVFTDIRQDVQNILADNHIYAPVIWPLGSEEMIVSDDVKYIYNHILAIPCDQRYKREDMGRIITIIKNIK